MRLRKHRFRVVAAAALVVALWVGCAHAPPAQRPAEAPAQSADRPSAYRHGWILLYNDPAQIARTIRAARRFGVGEIQLSHRLMMNIADLLGPDSGPRIALLNQAIELAHREGMKTYVWSHELADVGPAGFCFAPGSRDFEKRADAYRRGLAQIPGIDGVVLMFGSAHVPAWRPLCSCLWCLRRFPLGYPFSGPPNATRLRLITERLGGVIVGELHKELIMRTFVHRPKENRWHAEAFATAREIPFLGMHKAAVQDWQPYNPPDPTMGDAEGRDSLMELDAAGEYTGRSVLPFAAPGYFRYRLRHMFEHRGIGAVVRVEHYERSALGTPNEVNLVAVSELLKDPHTPLQAIWDDFIESFYGLGPHDAGQATLRRILEDTFPIRLQSHYVLGIWALEKHSDFPRGARLKQFHRRGRMPRWDPRWEAIWQALARPDEQTVLWIWQEGSEAVELATASLRALERLDGRLPAEKFEDLQRRLVHQKLAAEAWRAMKLFIWSTRALSRLHAPGREAWRSSPDSRRERLASWGRWAYEELDRIRAAMEERGLARVAVAAPWAIRLFQERAAWAVPSARPAEPDVLRFSPLRTVELGPERARLVFSQSRSSQTVVAYGLEPPQLDAERELGNVKAGRPRAFELAGLAPGRRYVVQLRTRVGGMELRSGYHWVFTPER